MKKILLIAMCVVSSINSWAQIYGNEWIDYSQTYYSIPIVDDGVYHITYETLSAAGVPVDQIDPRNYQLFNREKEVPLFIAGEGDGIFSSSDIIEFVGKGNDGLLDEQLYDNPQDFLNPYYSLFNDTIYYYLTWNESIDNLRYDLEENTSYEDYPQVDYLWMTSYRIFPTNYWGGQPTSVGGRSPLYRPCEGYLSSAFGEPWGGPIFDVELPTPHRYTGANTPLAKISTVLANTSDAPIQGPNHHLQVKLGNSLLTDTLFSGYQVNKFAYNVSVFALDENSTTLTHEVIDDLGIDADRHHLSWASVRYPHETRPNDEGDQYFEVPPAINQDYQYLALTDISNSPKAIFTLNEPYTKQYATYENEVQKALIPNVENVNMNCLLVDAEAVNVIPELNLVHGTGSFTDYGQLQPDSAFVIITHPNLWSSATAYADYRQNADRDAVVINVEELYDQFGGGVVHHELAIKRFLDFILSEWENPAQLFFIGKGIESQLCRNNTENFTNNLVPTFGWPGSDNMFSTGLGGNYSPRIATGRLSANTNEQVMAYLNKVSIYESQPPAEWMKHFMHFSGGANATEQTLFKNYIQGYKTIVEDTCYGAKVHSFSKNSDLPIEIALSDSIADRIAEGVTMMTFFGHATGNSFDYSIDNPENLVWNDHYPFFVGNSCYTGNIHLPGQDSGSEDFVLIPNKGAIGFLANVTLGEASSLNIYTYQFYNQIGRYNYGKPVGEQIKQAVQSMQTSTDDEVINTGLIMTLMGDPAIVLNAFDQPDYSVSEQDIFIQPEELNLLVDSIEVDVVVTNIAKATNDTVQVELIRQIPDGTTNSYFQDVIGLRYKDTLSFTMPLDYQETIGLNDFQVLIDLPTNDVPELDDFGNNMTSASTLVAEGSVFPVYPYDFAIVPEDNVTLKASTGNLLAVNETYQFEIDTASAFNSPFLQSHETNQAGGVISWALPFEAVDSTVYYWRVSVDSTENKPYQWMQSSYQHIDDQIGWGQSHFYQFEKNYLNLLDFNESDRQLDFLTGTKELKCQVLGNSFSTQESSEIRLDAERVEYAGCTTHPAIHIAVIDPITLEFWETNAEGGNPNHNFGQYNQGGSPCRTRPERYFIFQQHHATQMDSLVSMMTTKIPDGHFVLAYTWRYANYTLWDDNAPELYGIFNDWGATEIGNNESERPFIFFWKKGDPTTVQEIVGEDIDTYIELYADLPISGSNGKMTSTLIGPSQEWQRLWYDPIALETDNNDSTTIKVKGVQENGTETLLTNLDFDGDVTTEINLDLFPEIQDYPVVRLIAEYQDSITQTPSQTSNWHVNLLPVPEAAINPNAAFWMNHDSLQEGQILELAVAIDNLSDVDMDSLLVEYWILDAQQQRQSVVYPRQQPLLAGTSFVDTVNINTQGLTGIYQIWMEVNPFIDSLDRYDQLEKYHFNNIAHWDFLVSEDNINPVLDVSFDGLHILDGELVSAKPEILISLDDENPYLLMNEPSDTSFFSVFLTDPNGLEKRVYFTSNDEYTMDFVPAGNDNVAKVNYYPNLTQDGDYHLLVIASDKSGNASGDLNYSINFKVEQESSITEVMNYPNPFSTKTHFVFTLTGSEVPDQIRIQIMTSSGRVVKTIFKEELGPLRVGRNVTDYYWDGKDDFGDQLANGVYFYRVTATTNGEEIKKRTNNASRYFKKGFGKMYLMR